MPVMPCVDVVLAVHVCVQVSAATQAQLPAGFAVHVVLLCVLFAGLTAQELQQQQQQNGHHTAAAGDGFADDDMPGTGEGHVAVDHSAYGLMGGVGYVGDLGALGDHDNMEQQEDDDDGGGSDYRVTEAGDGEGSDGNYNDMELEDQGAAMEEEQF